MSDTPNRSPLDAVAAEPWIGALDSWLLAGGRHLRPWRKLGAHLTRQHGVVG